MRSEDSEKTIHDKIRKRGETTQKLLHKDGQHGQDCLETEKWELLFSELIA